MRIRVSIGCALVAAGALAGCKNKPVLISKNLKIAGNFSVKFSLVNPDFKIPREMDPGLTKFLDYFLARAKDNGQTIRAESLKGLTSIHYVNALEQDADGPPKAAVCRTHVARYNNSAGTETLVWKEIEVRRDIANQFGLESKGFLAIMVHEMFHCLMDKDHYTLGKAIMNPVLNLKDMEFIDNLETKYMKDLFDPVIMAKIADTPRAEEVKKENFNPTTISLQKIINNVKLP